MTIGAIPSLAALMPAAPEAAPQTAATIDSATAFAAMMAGVGQPSAPRTEPAKAAPRDEAPREEDRADRDDRQERDRDAADHADQLTALVPLLAVPAPAAGEPPVSASRPARDQRIPADGMRRGRGNASPVRGTAVSSARSAAQAGRTAGAARVSTQAAGGDTAPATTGAPAGPIAGAPSNQDRQELAHVDTPVAARTPARGGGDHQEAGHTDASADPGIGARGAPSASAAATLAAVLRASTSPGATRKGQPAVSKGSDAALNEAADTEAAAPPPASPGPAPIGPSTSAILSARSQTLSAIAIRNAIVQQPRQPGPPTVQASPATPASRAAPIQPLRTGGTATALPATTRASATSRQAVLPAPQGDVRTMGATQETAPAPEHIGAEAATETVDRAMPSGMPKASNSLSSPAQMAAPPQTAGASRRASSQTAKTAAKAQPNDRGDASRAEPAKDPHPAATAPSPAARAPVPASVPLPAATATLASGGAERQLDLARSAAWLDGVAHDIAATTDGGAPLRFQIGAPTLGPVRVELAGGAAGTAVMLTAASEQAKAMLSDARPQLIADARAQGLAVAVAHVVTANTASSGGQGGGAGQGQTPSDRESRHIPAFNQSGSMMGGSGAGGQPGRDARPQQGFAAEPPVRTAGRATRDAATTTTGAASPPRTPDARYA